MTTEKQDENILSALVTWLQKHSEEKLKKESDGSNKSLKSKEELNNSIINLADSLTKVIVEVTKLSRTLASTVKLVNEHSLLIEELYTVQTGILQVMKNDSTAANTAKTSSSAVQITLDNTKKKPEKPN